MSTDELDSSERRRLFGAFNKKIFKPFRAVGKSSRSPTDHTQEPVPAYRRLIVALKQPAAVSESPLSQSAAQMEQPASEPMTSRATPSIHSPGAGPSGRPSRPSFWWQSRSSSPALQVTTVAACRARRLLAGIQPPDPLTSRLPHSLKPNDPKNKPWHKYLLRKQNEHSARGQTGAPANQTTSSTSQQSVQPAQTSTSAQQPVQSPSQSSTRTGGPPSAISLTECGMFCLWLRRSEPRWR
ncbi:hypothetical protein PAXINDRAFT_18767 [Paxillus involutus ATCC 200175]|uniref:Uncharacterized protein n=1 Tax=Paxillus involutus ATCC 200175 TaxID=664439 RepID=A0A0C9TAE4_PAXIN|nr:hypothetical protein PAXINDRAFT_18767 [Paxillus involutus ATCC 200175]